MKVGILTYHKAHNYGAMLQAVALRTVVQKFGHNAFFVDYWPDYHRKRYELKSPSLLGIIRHPNRYFKLLQTKENRKKRIASFHHFQSKYIDPYCKSINDKYDLTFYGSDQIWRKQKPSNKYNPIYFGDKSICSCGKVSYAASTDKLPSNSQDESIWCRLLQNFNVISVREKELYDVCQKLGFNSEIVLDPTFLLSSTEWDCILDLEESHLTEKYILYYSIRGGVFDEKLIFDFAKKKGCKVIKLCANAGTEDSESVICTAGPKVFVSLIKNAEFVFTSSFHGLAFSINYHKEFFVSTDFATERITTLLRSVGLEDRYIDGTRTFPSVSSIDYCSVENLLIDRKNNSLDFLHKAFQL